MTDLTRPINQPGAPGQNTGHGHVYPRPDGSRARCGGPRRCRLCKADAERKPEVDEAALTTVVHESLAASGILGGTICIGEGSVCARVASAVRHAGWHR